MAFLDDSGNRRMNQVAPVYITNDLLVADSTNGYLTR